MPFDVPKSDLLGMTALHPVVYESLKDKRMSSGLGSVSTIPSEASINTREGMKGTGAGPRKGL